MKKKRQNYPVLGRRSRRILEILIKVLVSGLKEAWHFSEHFFRHVRFQPNYKLCLQQNFYICHD